MESFEFELWVDRGGTFTDCVLAERRTGAVRATKVLSTDEAPVIAARTLLGLPPDARCPPLDIRIGTTLATNALIERRYSRVALVTDRGLEDLIHIRDQARPELFARTIVKPDPIPEWIHGVAVRISADGTVDDHLDEAALRDALEAARASGALSVAVAIRFAPLAQEVEVRIERVARSVGFDDVTLSHRVVAEPGFLARLETTVVDAALSPPLRRYFEFLERALPGSRIRGMQSDGTLATPDRFRGKDAVLSGPAGGLVAASRVCEVAGETAALGFDMGGTSTDVSLIGRKLEPAPEGSVAGLRIRAPMLGVHTVAAGGGSICRVVAGRILVGPESAGAYPGPLCYGRLEAADLALTDVALVLGRLIPEHFPLALDRGRSLAGLEAEASKLPESSSLRDPMALASAFFDVAVATMARALADVSIAKGHDAREHALVVFGGAAGQYACAVARRIGMRRLVFHPLASVLSAYGMGLASIGATRTKRLRSGSIPDALEEAAGSVDTLENEVREALAAEIGPASTLRFETTLAARYERTETMLEIPFVDTESGVVATFEAAHRRAFGTIREGLRVEVVSVRVAGRVGRDPLELELAVAAPETDSDARPATAAVHLDGARVDVPVRARASFRVGERALGPMLVLDEGGTIVVERGFEIRLDEHGNLVAEDLACSAMSALSAGSEELDPVRLEVMGQLFASIAARMGEVLRRTATSPNIRDRLDFSCAVFDRDGGLVANAPHIPVHLGAMGDSVRAVLAAHGDTMEPGDVYVTNDPATGGSHLPDITVVAPIYDETGTRRLFVANRGHHADVGGRVPGSMPAFSESIADEGVVLRNIRLVRDGRFDERTIRAELSAGPYPARRIDDNVHDLEAQVAAVSAGIGMIHESFTLYGPAVVEAYVGHLQDAAENQVREAFSALPFRGERSFVDALDDGTTIAALIHLGDDGRLVVDFEGTAGPHRGNANVPRAVVKSAVLYLARMLVGRPMPLNEGCLRAVTLRLPDPSLVSPPAGAAVSSGNVETSQRIVDVLFGALGLGALSQGTMNNLTIGNADFAYYETLGGGAGATERSNGASAVHTHMTNSRLTDVEVLESAFPLRVVETSIRSGSGGTGRYRGGDGMIREIELLADATVSVVSERRVLAPVGADGGGPGALGRNFVDGNPRPGRFEEHLPRGSRIRLETPGGGGHGRD